MCVYVCVCVCVCVCVRECVGTCASLKSIRYPKPVNTMVSNPALIIPPLLSIHLRSHKKVVIKGIF